MHENAMARLWRASGAAIALIALAGCGLDTIEVVRSGETTIPAAPLGGVLPIDLPAFSGFTGLDFAASQELKNEGVEREDIDSIRVTRLTLAVVTPAEGTLGFLEELSIYVEAPGLPDARIGTLTAIPDEARELDFRLFDVELAPYATQPSMTLTVRGQGEPPRESTRLRLTARFEVDADLGLF